MSERYNTPDVRQLSHERLPDAAFPAARCNFRVYFDAETHARIVRHAHEDKSVEICGVLVGQWKQDDNGPFVAISECIRCDDAAKKSGEVTFTHDAWAQINQEMDTRFVDLKIVGWYHSHPGFGVFLSERDVFIHEHFFSNPGQVAFVVDPRQKTEGVFTWSNGKPGFSSHYWIGNLVYAAGDEKHASESEPINRVVAPTPVKNQPLPLLTILCRSMPWVAVFLIGYLLASMKSAWEEQRIIEGTVAHFGVWKCLKPELKERLADVAANVKAIDGEVNRLANQHVQLAGEDMADVKMQWGKVSVALRTTQEHLRLLGQLYGLDPAETAAWKTLFADQMAAIGRPGKRTAPSELQDAKDKASPEARPPESAPTDAKAAPKAEAKPVEAKPAGQKNVETPPTKQQGR
jgi:proteasome lid subunit RPN8/RPN11